MFYIIHIMQIPSLKKNSDCILVQYAVLKIILKNAEVSHLQQTR